MYKAFPVYDLRQGKILAVEPWLAPKDGFETLRDCHLRRGILEKREGYTFFGQILHRNTATKVITKKTDPVMGIYNYVSSGGVETLLAMDKARINKYISGYITDLSVTLTDGGGGTVSAAATAHGLETNDIATLSDSATLDATYHITRTDADNFTFTATWDASNTTGTVNEEPFSDLTENKIHFSYKNASGTTVQVHTLIVGDTLTGATSGATATVAAIIVDQGSWAATTAVGTIILTRGSLSSTFQAENITDGTNVVGYIAGASSDEAFTGDSTNFFWITNWNEISFITNDNNAIQKFDGAHLSTFYIDLTNEGGDENNVTRCKMIFIIKGRIVIFDTTESTDGRQRQRARWSDVADPDTWTLTNYLDADTSEGIISAGFLGDDLIVFFENSTWKFIYTGDAAVPFRWDRIDSQEGSFATHSTIRFSDEVITVSSTKIIGTDGREVYSIDKKIPDFTLTWLQGSVEYSHAFNLREERQAYLSYASEDAPVNADGNYYPDSAVIINYEDKSFSTYSLPAHSFGISRLETERTWQSEDVWEDIEYTWDAKILTSGYRTTLMGNHAGKIFQLNNGGDDDGSSIEFNALGGRWNPFVEEGRKAACEKIGFFVDNDEDASFLASVYKNTSSTSYTTKTISCDGSGDKFWVWIFCDGEIGDFHRLEISHTEVDNRPRIHAIVPYFERAGRLDG